MKYTRNEIIINVLLIHRAKFEFEQKAFTSIFDRREDYGTIIKFNIRTSTPKYIDLQNIVLHLLTP